MTDPAAAESGILQDSSFCLSKQSSKKNPVFSSRFGDLNPQVRHLGPGNRICQSQLQLLHLSERQRCSPGRQCQEDRDQS